jgi:thiamine biosynthesis lipoprotein
MTAIGAPVAFPALGTTAVVLLSDLGGDVDAAVCAVRTQVDLVDAACSRFRSDSELSALNAAGGAAFTASPVLLGALDVALRAARLTDGLVDPTVGDVMRAGGYDRDFADVAGDGPAVRLVIGPVPGWRAIAVDRSAGTVRVPAGVTLDLGATAKAWCADRAATSAASASGSGVLVSLGGDVAVAGPPPPGGWRVRVTDHHAAAADAPGQTIAITSGGLATSGTTARRWRRGGEEIHHIIDPATGRSAAGPWRTVSVVAGTCADANAASTAAIIMGAAAPAWLEAHGISARLVTTDSACVRTGEWPEELV